MKRELTICLVILLATGAVFFALQPSESTNLARIGYRNHLLYLPAMVAFENNLFEKYGLNSEEKLFEQTKDLLFAMSSSQIDASYGGINLLDLALVNQKSNGSVKLFSTTMVDSNNRVTCLTSKNYSSLNSLNGKKVGHVAGAFGLAWAKEPFKAESLSADFIPLQNDLLLQSLEAGSVDAVYLIEPGCAKAESLGYKIVINEPIALFFSDGFYLATTVVGSDISDNKQKIIVAVYDEAIDFIRANPEQAREILSKYTKLKPELAQRVAIPHFLKSTEWTPEKLEQSIDILVEHELINSTSTANLYVS